MVAYVGLAPTRISCMRSRPLDDFALYATKY